jgi:hypothetical protein
VAGISPVKTKQRKQLLEGMQRVPDLNVVQGPIQQETTTTTTISSHKNLQKDVKASTASTSSYKVTTTKLMDDDDDDDEDEEEEEDEDEKEVIVEEEEDEEYIFEERMGLRLGKGGRIGVLDVRCVLYNPSFFFCLCKFQRHLIMPISHHCYYLLDSLGKSYMCWWKMPF